MSLRDRIIQALTETPDLDSNEIAEKLSIKLSQAKVALCKMSSAGYVVRERKPVKVAKAGGKTQYQYRVK